MNNKDHDDADRGAKLYAEELARDGWDEWAPPVGSAGFHRGYKTACIAKDELVLQALKTVNAHLDRVDAIRAETLKLIEAAEEMLDAEAEINEEELAKVNRKYRTTSDHIIGGNFRKNAAYYKLRTVIDQYKASRRL